MPIFNADAVAISQFQYTVGASIQNITIGLINGVSLKLFEVLRDDTNGFTDRLRPLLAPPTTPC